MTPADTVIWTFTLAACLIVGSLALAVAIAIVRAAIPTKRTNINSLNAHDMRPDERIQPK